MLDDEALNDLLARRYVYFSVNSHKCVEIIPFIYQLFILFGMSFCSDAEIDIFEAVDKQRAQEEQVTLKSADFWHLSLS